MVLSEWLSVFAYGAARGLFCLPIEHPFDLVKTKMQATQKSVRSVLHNTVATRGLIGLYTGFQMNALREVLK
jgi:hypothetical protein